MPTYQLKCPNGHVFDRYLKVKDYNVPQKCSCGEYGKRQIVAPMIAPMFEDYESPIDGAVISSKRKRVNDLAKSGCVPYEPTMVKDHNAELKKKEDKFDKEVDHTVEQAIMQMSSDQKEKLGQELQTGADLSYQRIGE